MRFCNCSLETGLGGNMVPPSNELSDSQGLSMPKKRKQMFNIIKYYTMFQKIYFNQQSYLYIYQLKNRFILFDFFAFLSNPTKHRRKIFYFFYWFRFVFCHCNHCMFCVDTMAPPVCLHSLRKYVCTCTYDLTSFSISRNHIVSQS